MKASSIGSKPTRRAAVAVVAGLVTSAAANIPKNVIEADDAQIAAKIKTEGTQTRTALRAATVQGIQTPDDPIQTALNAQIQQATFTVNIEDFSPNADFAAALSSAIDAAENGGTILFQPGKTYYARSGVVKADVNFRPRMNGAKIVRASDMPSVPILDLRYSITDVQNVTGITTVNYTHGGTSTSTQVSRVQVASAAGWRAGDVCKIVSDDLIPWSIPTLENRAADIFEVLAVEDNYLFTPTPLRVPLSTNVRVGKMTTKRAALGDFWVEDDIGSPVARNAPSVVVRAPVNLRMDRPRAENLRAEGFQINSGFRSVYTEPRGNNIRTSQANNAWGYAIRENGPVDSQIIGGSGANLRHLYTSNAFAAVAPGTSELWRYGGAVNVVQQGGLAGSTGHSAWDFHDEAIHGAILDASTRFNHRQPLGSQMGLKLRGKNHLVKGFTSHGPGGIVEEGRDNGGGHVITNHVHLGIPGWDGGTAHQIDNRSPGRLNSHYSGEVHWDDYRGEMYRYSKADVHVPSIKAVVRSANTGACRLFYLVDSRAEIDELTVDLRGSTGTGASEPRIFFLADALSEVIVHRLIVRAGGAPWRIGDLSKANGTVRVEELVTDTLPNSYQGGFANVGSGATFHADSIRLNGMDLAKGVEDRGAAPVTLNPFSAGIQRLTAPLTSGVIVTEATVGVPPGREITYHRTASATGGSWWNIGNDRLETASTWLRRRWSGTKWETAARGSA